MTRRKGAPSRRGRGPVGGGAAAGLVAVVAVCLLAVAVGGLPRRRFCGVLFGASLGLALAVYASFVTAITGVGPVLGFALVGLGGVAADAVAAADERAAARGGA